MRAVVMSETGGPEVLRVETVADPTPGDGEVVLRIEACGVCGFDVMGRAGLIPGYRLPMIPGHELAGEVVALGPGVTTVAVGDRVASRQRRPCYVCEYCVAENDTVCAEDVQYGGTIPGGYAEFCAVHAQGLAPIPDGVDWPAAAIAACAIGTTVHALKIADIRPDQVVAVTGAGGGVGVHALQIAKAAGCRVVAVTSSPGKRAGLARFADLVVDGTGRFDVTLRENGLGPDVILEMTAGVTLDRSLRAVRRTGKVVIIGNIDPNPQEIVPGALISREIQILGSNSASRGDLVEALELVRRGAVQPVIADVLPLDAAPLAHKQTESQAVLGRLVLAPPWRAG